MAYDYQPHDNIFDIESMTNLYVDTHYYPAQNLAIIYYLSDVEGYHDFDKADPKTHQSISLEISKKILQCNKSLRELAKDKDNPLGIRFRNLRRPMNLAKYCHFWGLTPTRNSSLNYMNAKGQIHPVTDRSLNYARKHNSRPHAKWVSENAYNNALLSGKEYSGANSCNMVTPYYTVKRTDPKYDKKKYGITMGFNSDNYDLTMIAAFLGHVVHNTYARNYINELCNKNSQLAKDEWSYPSDSRLNHDRTLLLDGQKEKDPKNLTGYPILSPEFFRHFNNELFTTYKRSMPQLLQHQPDLQPRDEADSKSFFKQIDNPAYYIYKGWMTSNRYLDVANLNEHMKFVPLKRIAAMEGWQILESKNVTANTTEIHGIVQIADLIGYNNSDVQVTKQVFELAQYQDALTLRRIMLKKFPQLTYNFKLKPALTRYYKRTIKHIDKGNLNPVEKINAKNKISGIKEAIHSNKSSKMYKYYQKARSAADPQDADPRPDNLRFSPLTDDATSAKLISNVIAPYHSMEDWPDIEFWFPDPRALKIFRAKHPEMLDILPKKPFDVLDDTMNWAKKVDKKYGLSDLPPANEDTILHDGHSLAKTFQPIYDLYREVEGHNANDTLKGSKKKLYNVLGKLETVGPSLDMTDLLHHTNANIPYLHRDGNETGTIATFSYGGIHGVEFKLHKYINDYKKYVKKQKQIDYFRNTLKLTPQLAKQRPFINYHGTPLNPKDFVKGSGKNAKWKNDKPLLYKHPSGSSYILNDDYDYVSVGAVRHEDFSGYYPMLISREGIMWPHDEPKDTYHQIYVERLHLKHQLKKYTKNSHPWNVINIKQLLRKLLLNSASGAGDAKFFNSIRMNNKIISMRIIGQLFTWRMGQAECLAGMNAKVTSTNTDGEYLQNIPGPVNDKTLQETVAPLTLFISPVPLVRFVSKDANNRAEVENHGTEQQPKPVLAEAKGATLNGWMGPSVTATISHPAIIDYALAHYLAYQPDPCNSKFKTDVIYKLIEKKRQELLSKDPAVRQDGMTFFQWVIASNPDKHRYPYIRCEKQVENPVYNPLSTKKEEREPYVWKSDDDLKKTAIAIPHTNRLFLMKHPKNKKGQLISNSLFLASRQKVQEATFRKLQDKGKLDQLKNDPDVIAIFDNWGDRSLSDNAGSGYSSYNYKGSIAKLPSMPVHQNVLIEDHALNEISLARSKQIAQKLDMDAYVEMIATKFHASWDNNED